MTLGRPKEDHVKNFWNNVEKHSECWHWIGSRNDSGYGAAWFNGRLWPAHRLSFYLHHGSIDENLMILHSFDKPWCVKPDHLRQGTPKENSMDAVARDRHFRPRPRGLLINTDASSLPINPPMKIKKNLESSRNTCNETWVGD